MKIGTFARNTADVEAALKEQPDFIELRFDENEQFDIRPAVKRLDDEGISFLFHLPRQPDWSVDDIRSVLPYVDLARRFNARLVTFHAPLSTILYTDEEIATFLRLVEPLLRAADDAGITLSVETLGTYYTELTLLFDMGPRLMLTLDLGHGQLFTQENRAHGHIAAFIDRIALVNVHDNKARTMVKELTERRGEGRMTHAQLREMARQYDLHLPIGQGSIDFRALFHDLKVRGYDGMFLMLAHDRRLFSSERETFLRMWNEC